MTPTPDPPPAAPLTAEQIAAIRDQVCGIPDYDDYNPQHYAGMEAVEKGVLDRLTSSHEALRDRLARVEAQIETLRRAMCNAEDAISRGQDDHALRLLDAALSAPTDGAARGGWGGRWRRDDLMDALRRKAMRRYSKDELVFMVDRGEPAQYERDALARTLATLTAAGITTGEDGEPRFCGLSGAEIEGQRKALREIAAIAVKAAIALATAGRGADGEGRA